MVFCNQCGEKAVEGDKYCDNCGGMIKLRESNTVEVKPDPTPATPVRKESDQEPKPPQKRGITLSYLIRSGFGLLLIIMGLTILDEAVTGAVLFTLFGILLLPQVKLSGTIKTMGVVIIIILIIVYPPDTPSSGTSSKTSQASNTNTIIPRETSGSEAMKICYKEAEKCDRGVPRIEREMKRLCDEIYDYTGVSYRLAEYVEDLC